MWYNIIYQHIRYSIQNNYSRAKNDVEECSSYFEEPITIPVNDIRTMLICLCCPLEDT